jgi:dUTP pyrophosphatase
MNELIIDVLDEQLRDYYATIKTYSSDCGFDLYCPNNLVVPAGIRSFKIRLGIKTKLTDFYTNLRKGYMLVPRSSTGSKTPLRLSNSVGIIDPTYVGELIAIVDNVSNMDYNIQMGDRLFQIVPFDGCGIVRHNFGLVGETKRGEGGLGSTGR